MSAPIGVGGGTDGITARFEDMVGVAGLLDRAAAEVEDTVDLVNAAAFWCRMAVSGALDLIASMRLQAMLEDLASPVGAMALIACRLRLDALRLRFAAAAYRASDDGIGTAIARSLTLLPHALGVATLDALAGGGLRAGAQVVLADAPELVDAAAVLTPAGALESLIGARYPDGHAVVTDRGRDRRPGAPPHDLADLVEGLAVRSDGSSGEISVSFVTAAQGVRRVIVDIPGTKSWASGPSSDVTSLSTNARALVGAPTAYEQGVLAAMARAGVRADDEVMLVGHSEGGTVAVNAARRGVRSGRFRITHVVTAGSPVGRTVASLPSAVRVLALENDRDVVPHADGRANPDRRSVTTVTVHHGDGTVLDDHDLRDSYRPGAEDADRSDNASVRDFVRSAAGFLGAAGIDTHVFVITRSYR
jgi:hypothetical protein